MIDKNELKKLRPADRIKRLKQMQEKRKKESSEIEQLIKESEQEAKTNKIAEEVTPRPREVDISELFGVHGENLEVQVRRGVEVELGGAPGYIPLEQQASDYETLKDILPYASSSRGLTEEQRGVIDEIGERLENLAYKTEAKKASEVHVASVALHHKIRKYAGLD